ncbi:transposase [Bacillus sp. MUM 116]|nr:transposase [Bacillus sp. MUM 116]
MKVAVGFVFYLLFDLEKDLFANTDINAVKDSYWKKALKFYSELNDEGKEILFKVIEQLQVDTVSNVLGIFDGIVSISDEEIEINMTVEGIDEPLNGELQDLFLEYDEENR